MKDPKILAVPLIILVAIMVPGTTYAADFTTISSATKRQDGNALMLSVTANGDIPRLLNQFPNNFFNSNIVGFGYAWVNTNTGKGIAVVIGPKSGVPILPTSPDKWGRVFLGPGLPAGPYLPIRVGHSPIGEIHMQHSSASVLIPLQQTGISSTDLNIAYSFILHPDSHSTTGLAIQALSSVPVQTITR